MMPRAGKRELTNLNIAKIVQKVEVRNKSINKKNANLYEILRC